MQNEWPFCEDYLSIQAGRGVGWGRGRTQGTISYSTGPEQIPSMKSLVCFCVVFAFLAHLGTPIHEKKCIVGDFPRDLLQTSAPGLSRLFSTAIYLHLNVLFLFSVPERLNQFKEQVRWFGHSRDPRSPEGETVLLFSLKSATHCTSQPNEA